MKRTTSFKIWALAIILFIVAGFIFLNSGFGQYLLLDPYRRAKIDEVQAHKQMWFEQKITSYKIGIRFMGYMSEFPQEYTVLDGVSDRMNSGENCNDYDCAFPTIDDLFDRLIQKNLSRYCGRDGCACNGPWTMDVIYDERYKFPKTANRINDYAARGMFKNWWEERPLCLGYVDFDMIYGWEIYSFIPID